MKNRQERVQASNQFWNDFTSLFPGCAKSKQ